MNVERWARERLTLRERIIAQLDSLPPDSREYDEADIDLHRFDIETLDLLSMFHTPQGGDMDQSAGCCTVKAEALPITKVTLELSEAQARSLMAVIRRDCYANMSVRADEGALAIYTALKEGMNA